MKATAVAFLLTTSTIEMDSTSILSPPPQLRSCAQDTNCVLSYYLELPNCYISPLLSRQWPKVSFQQALRDLSQYKQAKVIESIVPKDGAREFYYIHMALPGTAPNSLDDIELFFERDDSNVNYNSNDDTTATIVNLRCQARVTLPPPPFCVRRNCINGNMD